MENVLDTPYVLFEMKEGVLFGTYKKGLRIDLEIAQSIVAARLRFTEGKAVPAVLLNQGVVSVDKRARVFFASPDGSKGLKAVAMLLDSAFATFFANFYLSVNKPPMPVRIFTNPPAAIKWIQQFREEVVNV